MQTVLTMAFVFCPLYIVLIRCAQSHYGSLKRRIFWLGMVYVLPILIAWQLVAHPEHQMAYGGFLVGMSTAMMIVRYVR